MLPHIHRATQKFYIFLIVYLTGCTPRYPIFVTLVAARWMRARGANIQTTATKVTNRPYWGQWLRL